MEVGERIRILMRHIVKQLQRQLTISAIYLNAR